MASRPSPGLAAGPDKMKEVAMTTTKDSDFLGSIIQEIESEFGRRRIVFFVAPDGVRTEIMQIIADTGHA